jgi:predicted site-specific integrase-resolvase
MIVQQQQLAKRLGVSTQALRTWTRNGYFGDVPKVGHPPAYQYDLAAVKAALEARKIRVAVGAFDDLATAKPKTKAKAK